MTDFKHKENSGSIFRNDKKVKETQPDYSGTINVQGKEWQISLWIKEGKKGKYFSAAIKEPYKKDSEKPSVTVSEKPDNNDLPF